MKVWFGCTTLDWLTYREYYFKIRDELVKNDCIIVSDWLETADKAARSKTKKSRPKRSYHYAMKAVYDADLIVIENTVPNFSTSHQITIALQRRKPTLVLKLHTNDSLFTDSYIESLQDPNLTVKEYTNQNIAKRISEFVNFNKLGNTQKRYNIVLEKKHKYYLDWAHQVSGSSRSEIIRNLVEEEMRKDKNFRRYLGKIDNS